MNEQIPAPGHAAPDFSGQAASPEGQREVRLSSYAGRYLVLYFYPKDSTSGCTSEALEFSELVPRFAALGAEILGVSKDSLESHRKFIEKFNLKICLLSDPDKIALEAYGAFRMKKQYGKEAPGTVRSTFLIDPQGKIAASWPKIAKASGHALKVLESLDKISEKE